VAGTGSRRFLYLPGPKKTEVRSILNDVLEDLRSEHEDKLLLMSGMAEGWDEEIARTAIKLSIPFAAIIPNKGYGKYYWGEHSLSQMSRLKEFDELVSQAIHVEYVMPTAAGSSKYFGKYGYANFDRNDRMVALGHYFIAYDPSSPGTSHCCDAIKNARKNMFIITPEAQTQEIVY
jgi:hypothetical protein